MIILEVTKDLNYLQLKGVDVKAEYEQLRAILTRKVQNYMFMPAYKSGHWGGDISFMDDYNRIPYGLYSYIQEKMESFNYQCKINGVEKLVSQRPLFLDKFTEFCSDLIKDKPDIKVRDYQIEAAYNILKSRRCCNQMATSAGKTLMAYFVIAYGSTNKLMKNILYVVPRKDLVDQASEDFIYYNSGTELELYIQRTGHKEVPNPNITIGTYQSLCRKDKSFFKNFDCVFVDEAHNAVEATKSIMQKNSGATYRIGMTGTIPDEKYSAYLQLISFTGPIVNRVQAIDLIEGGFATPPKINIIKLDYAPLEVKRNFADLKSRGVDGIQLIKKEKDYIKSSLTRFNFIVNTISKVSKNSLVLYSSVEDGYGKKIQLALTKKLGENKVYYIDGKTKSSEREDFKDIFKGDNNGIIIVASFGTFQMGISLKNIFNIFLVESVKSQYVIVQSIGRGLREYEGKKEVNIVDFVDDMSCVDRNGKHYKNYVLKHMEERIKEYENQKYEYSIKCLNLKSQD